MEIDVAYRILSARALPEILLHMQQLLDCGPIWWSLTSQPYTVR